MKHKDYYSDVIYSVWRSGGNPDLVDYDRLDNYYYEDLDSDIATNLELRKQREKVYEEIDFDFTSDTTEID